MLEEGKSPTPRKRWTEVSNNKKISGCTDSYLDLLGYIDLNNDTFGKDVEEINGKEKEELVH